MASLLTELLLGFAPGESRPKQLPPPSDPARLNAFTHAYNAFLQKYREGVVDWKLWQDACHKWSLITRPY